MTVDPQGMAKGPAAYCTAQLDIYHDEPDARVVVTGCVMNPDGTLVNLMPGPDTVQFNVTVPLDYGDGQKEMSVKVADALETAYGFTGLTAVKFVPSF